MQKLKSNFENSKTEIYQTEKGSEKGESEHKQVSDTEKRLKGEVRKVTPEVVESESRWYIWGQN